MKTLAFLLPMVLALAACGDTPEENLAKARADLARHDYAAARIRLANALAAQPGDRALLLLQARTLIALGDGQGAGTSLEKLAGSAPTGELAELSAEAALLRDQPSRAMDLLGALATPEAERLRALASIRQGKLDEAGDFFAKAIAAGGNARTYADYCRYRLLAGDVAGAQDMAAKAAALDPEGLDTLLVRGQMATRRGDLKAALDAYGAAADTYPSSLAALTGKAAVLGELGRTDEMEAAVARAAAFAPRDLTVIYLKARAATARKDWAEVRGAVQPVETGLARLHPIRLLYGQALSNLGQHELAMAQLRPIANAQPGNAEARRLLAAAQLAAGDAAGALATIRPLADATFARPEDLTLAAKAAEAAGDGTAARYAQRAAAPAGQALGRDLSDADAAMRAGNWAAAVAAYDRILRVTDGRNVLVLNNMAYAQLMLGNGERAQQFAQRALREAPDNASVLDTAGWVAFKAGKDPDKARSLLRQAAQKAPNNPTIRAHLAEASRPG